MSLGIAMNGGAIRCTYYTGFLQYIYENKIIVDEISALSSGVVSALIYFSGENPREMFYYFTNNLAKNRLNPKIFSILLKEFIDEYYSKWLGTSTPFNPQKRVSTALK